MRILFLSIALFSFMAAPALADHTPEHSAAVDTTVVKVSGMVCDFCARSLEKVFYKEDGIAGVKINLDDETVTLDTMKDKPITDEKINELIEYSGYTVIEITRAQ